jgi:hypothetical protein
LGGKMSWDNVDNKLKKGVDARFVSCEEKYERDYIKKSIKEAFPSKYSDISIEQAIESCCKSLKSPRPRKDFIECLKTKLR